MTKPKISLKIFFNSGVVKKVTSRKIKRIRHILKANNFSDCIFEVVVTYESGGINEAVCGTKKELIESLKIFMEKGL